MRWTLLILLVLVFAVRGGEGNEAEKLYRGLEKKIGKAKALHLAFASKLMKGANEVGHFKGSIALMEGNKARIEVKGSTEGNDISLKLVSDGKNLKITANPPGKESELPLPKRFGANVRTGLSRVGPSMGMVMVGGGGDKEGPDFDKLFRPSDFKLGANTKVAGRDARTIQYKVTISGKETASVKLWLDAKTLLPLKREITGEKQGESMRILESYSEFKLGKKGGGKSSAPPK